MNSNSIIKQEFFNWIRTIDISSLSDIDKKLLNVLIDNFDDIAPIGTAHGKRAKYIAEIIENKEKELSTRIPEIKELTSEDEEIVETLKRMQIGPFRGFAREESFSFDKKYIFMFGPNGSGKSSFCEGLEYALLGNIEEANAKRIDISKYIENIDCGRGVKPKVFGMINGEEKEISSPNPNEYRFCFVEKNRIDGFARIAATTDKNQSDRISTLFGMDEFNEFVNGFTTEFHNYLTLENKKEKEFEKEKAKYEASKENKAELLKQIKENKQSEEELIKEVNEKEVKNISELKLFLSGEDNSSGKINELQEMKAKIIEDDVDKNPLSELATDLKSLDDKRVILVGTNDECKNKATSMNYKSLYTALSSLKDDKNIDKSICPACKTSIEKVKVNPFENAKLELSKMDSLIILQDTIKSGINEIGVDIKMINEKIKKINVIKEKVKNAEDKVSIFTEINFSGYEEVEKQINKLNEEIEAVRNSIKKNIKLDEDIESYNKILGQERADKDSIDKELKKYEDYKTSMIKIQTLDKKLRDDLENENKTIVDFEKVNSIKIEEIEELNKIIVIRKKYIDSYEKLINDLFKYKIDLPSKLASGLAEKTKEFYNIINSHDAEVERIKSLKLPTKSGEKIEVEFFNRTGYFDALQVFSEGHIKIFGLSLLLSKAVIQDFGFIVFDDIINAIDDNHRDGVAELLMKSESLKGRQYIITCHGDNFIVELESKLGPSECQKNVKSYNFLPVEGMENNGIKVITGTSKNYLLRAKNEYEKNNLKDAVGRCRQSLEMMTERICRIIQKEYTERIPVEIYKPGDRPDLYSMMCGLIKRLERKPGKEELVIELKTIKEKYSWWLLNKGIHVEIGLPEYEREDVKRMIKSLEKIDSIIN